MAIEIVKNSKQKLDDEIAAIGAIERKDLPTKMLGGKLRPVHAANHKRRLTKEAVQANSQSHADKIVADLVADGETKAASRARGRKITIYLDGLPVAEDVR